MITSQQEQLVREKATSQLLREQLEATYREFKKVQLSLDSNYIAQLLLC